MIMSGISIAGLNCQAGYATKCKDLRIGNAWMAHTDVETYKQ